MPRNIFSDPLLTKAFSSVLSPDGNKLHAKAISWSIAAGILEGLSLGLIVPTISGLIDFGGLDSISWWLGAMAVLALAAIWVFLQQQRTAYMCAIDILNNLHQRIGDKLARLPIGWFGPRRTGTVSQLSTEGIMSIGGAIAHGECELIRTITALATTNLVILVWRPQLGLALFAGALLVALCLYLARMLRDRGHQLNVSDRDEVSRRIVEFASCQPALRAAGRSQDYEPLADALAADKKSSLAKSLLSEAALIISNFASQITVVVLFVTATALWAGGHLHPVALIAFLGVALRFKVLLEQFVAQFTAADLVRGPIGEVEEILEATELPEPDSVPEDSTKQAMPAPGMVEFHEVGFGYDSDTSVLNGVSFQASPGTLTAIVGPSGSGKTTLFRLMCRFWDINSGVVRVGGVDVREQTSAQLMRQITMVFQDPYLYDDTLLANIKMGSASMSPGPDAVSAGDADVFAAAEMAGVRDIAQRLPGGWDCPVGSGGRKLSGGERQRVSIARALLKNAPIVLLDEATSALDPENEARIQDCIATLRRSSTVMIIAHNLNTIVAADQIVVLNSDGTVESIGKHDALLESSPIYAGFWQSRRSAAGWSLSR
ncbi:ABC transporter ATP-binding protein [Corynebacterium casei]|uniref:ABC transporter ATP-binding protein n=1 Tax=Corynebacterium casei TaxID=160386 RepID=UPI003FD2C827